MRLERSGRSAGSVLCFALAIGLGTPVPSKADEPIGDAIAGVPIFDAHMHYKEPAWQPFPVQTVIELMDKSGVAMALVSSTPDEGTIRLWEYAPERIVPELRPYHGDAGSSNWTKAPEMLAYLEGRLKKYPHRGIGEFHVHAIDPNDREFLSEVATLAARHEILLHIHSGADPVKLFYELEPELTVIWAHAGLTEPPDSKIMWINNTLDVAEVECSAAYLDEAQQRGDLTILTEPRPLPLDAEGNLPNINEMHLEHVP